MQVRLAVIPVLKRSGLLVEDGLPWQEFRFEEFGSSPLLNLDVLDPFDELWEAVSGWLEMHPGEPADFEYNDETGPVLAASGIRRAGANIVRSVGRDQFGPMLRRAGTRGYPAFRHSR